MSIDPFYKFECNISKYQLLYVLVVLGLGVILFFYLILVF